MNNSYSFLRKTNYSSENGPFYMLDMSKNKSKCFTIIVNESALDRKLIKCLVIEPNAPDILMDQK